MSQRKNDFDIATNDLMFKEEVPEDLLYSKIDVDDHIYEDEEIRRRRVWFLIVLAIILILLSIISAVMGFMLLDKGKDKLDNPPVVTKYDLFVTHFNNNYGGVIKSFANYTSSDNPYMYKFSISNNNPVKLGYDVDLNYDDYGKNSVDMSQINYSLARNGVDVKTGTLIDARNNRIYTTDIGAKLVDEYVIKLWSSANIKNFKFKINITV